MLRPYPTSIDASAWALIWAAYKNKTGITPALVHVAYEASGVALGKLYPDPTSPMVMMGVATRTLGKPDEDALETAFAELSKPESDTRTVSAIAMPWSIILQVILSILQGRWQ